MKEGQQHIYYLLAPGLAAAKASPHLEAFRKKGIEVLLLGEGEGIDNWVVASLRDFDGKRLQSVAQGSGDLSELEDEAEAAAKEQASAEFAGLVGQLKAALDGRACDVRVSSRLTTSPACIVANEAEIDINLARRLRGSGLPSQPVLEINPQHPLVRRLNREPADPHLAEWAHVLFDQAVLTLGARMEEPAAFVNRLNDLLVTLCGSHSSGPCAGSGALADVPDAPAAPGKLLAVSDLHVSYPQNRQWVEDLPPGSPGDWLLVVGDVAEKVADIEWALRTLSRRFGTVVWVPGNHDLWSHPADPVQLRGEERYQHLVARCRDLGVITPEDPLPGVAGRRRPCGDRPAVPALRLHVPPGRRQHQGRGAGPGLRQTGLVGTDERACTPTRTRAGRRGARRGSTRPCRAWRPSTPGCRPSWSTTFRSPASPPGSCATPRSPSGAAPSRRPTGTCGTALSPSSTATCTSPGPSGRTGCGSRRCRSATPRSRTSTRTARAS